VSAQRQPLRRDLTDMRWVTIYGRSGGGRPTEVPAGAWLGYRSGRCVAYYCHPRAAGRALASGPIDVLIPLAALPTPPAVV